MFDYKDFAKDMAEQAKGLVPEEFSKKDKDYLVGTLKNFTLLCGESLENDEELDFTYEQKVLISQIIAEWTFHKACDIIRSGISEQFYDIILQKLAFTAYEISKQGVLKELDQAELLKAVEYNIQKCYVECIEELYEKNQISEKERDCARQQSSIDSLTEKIKWEKDNPTDDTTHFIPQKKDYYKNFKLNQPEKFDTDSSITQNIKDFCSEYKITIGATIVWISILARLFFKGVIDFTGLSTAIAIWCIVIAIGFYVARKITIQKQLKQLEDVRQKMQDLVNPDKMYERLGVDLVTILVGAELLTIADPDQDGQLLAKMAAMRQRLTDNLGYIIPNIRILDSNKLQETEYRINIRDNKAAEGFVFPDKYMILADEWDNKYDTPPDCSYLVGVDPTYKTQVYWVNKDDISDNDITAVSPEDVIIKHLEEVLIKNVDEILTINDVYKYLALVKDGYSSSLVNELLERLSVADMRKIFVTLIRERVSIKDICFIFEKMYDYSRFTTNPTALSERIRASLGRQICLNYADENNILYAVKLSQEWETELEDAVETTELGVMFNLKSREIEELVEAVAVTLMRAHQACEHEPVILVSPRIRLPLYELLVMRIPTVSVLSYSELITEIKVELLETIE